jgi:hypothetical protein
LASASWAGAMDATAFQGAPLDEASILADIEPLHVATYVCLNGVFDVGRETAKCIQRQ